MLPFYSLLEQPHRACDDKSRPSFAPARRVSLQDTNQHVQLAHSQRSQQQTFEQTCGAQTQQLDRADSDSHVTQPQRGEKCSEEKEQLDGLDQSLAYPTAPSRHSEADIESANSRTPTAARGPH